jgi:hypothetical protein
MAKSILLISLLLCGDVIETVRAHSKLNDSILSQEKLLEELGSKWGTDVSEFVYYHVLHIVTVRTVGLLWRIYLCASETCQMFDSSGSTI